ncbi:hypothetical protein BpHYR1_021773 [Brachionus plicatilis]|uniref:Endonuclease/exonuclease/phosphatase domain-containing protein n=1 Tax=Brachionus plicatilis TaxID=10195 RepID=A0A3M7SXR8_BRAPC|nr:hypothetical protein BpHYR1_021773 [Brachionus plicatilis]
MPLSRYVPALVKTKTPRSLANSSISDVSLVHSNYTAGPVEIARSAPEHFSPIYETFTNRNQSSDESSYSSALSSQSSPSSSSSTSDVSFLWPCCEQIWVAPPQNDTNCPSDSDIAISTSLESTSNLLRSGKYSGIILMGDFNLPHVEWNEDGVPMLIDVSTKKCHSSNSSLVQMIKEETFFCNEHPISLLDLVLVSDPNRVTNGNGRLMTKPISIEKF